MNDLNVKTFKPSRSPFYKAWWIDPETGQRREKSTKTKSGRDAERFAARLEKELRDGTYADPSRVTWEVFRDRYECEVLAGLADTTADKASTVFNAVEDIIGPRLLRQVDANAISKLVKALRDRPRSESTISGYLSHLRAALAWGVSMKLLPVLPTITMPKRAKRSKMMRGRPITGEEFERMLAAVPKALAGGQNTKRKNRYTPTISDATVESWRHLLRGLWWSGLRLTEALALTWDDDRLLRVDRSGRYAMLRIPAELEKGHKDRLLPISPEFAEFLDATPVDEQTGFVFAPLPVRPERITRPKEQQVGRMFTRFGRLAAVKVDDKGDGKVKWASAHDLRRSFGERWAVRVMPQVLMELMRHEAIETTLKYYVGRNAETTAAALYAAVAGDGFGDGMQNHENRAGTENAESPT